jgi:hypothetical protein
MINDEYNIHIENVLKDLIPTVIENDIDIDIQPTFEEADKQELSCMMHRADLNRFGIISVLVEEYPDDDIVFFTFNPKLYKYAKMEGFDHVQMFEDLSVFKKVSKDEYFDHILGCDG